MTRQLKLQQICAPARTLSFSNGVSDKSPKRRSQIIPRFATPEPFSADSNSVITIIHQVVVVVCKATLPPFAPCPDLIAFC